MEEEFGPADDCAWIYVATQEKMDEQLEWERECAIDEVREAQKKIGDAYIKLQKALESYQEEYYSAGNVCLEEAKELLKDIGDYLNGVA